MTLLESCYDEMFTGVPLEARSHYRAIEERLAGRSRPFEEGTATRVASALTPIPIGRF